MRLAQRLRQIIGSYTHRAEHEAALDALLQDGKAWGDVAHAPEEEFGLFLDKVTTIPNRIIRKRADRYFMSGQFDLLCKLHNIYPAAQPSKKEVVRSYDHYNMTNNVKRAWELYRATGIRPEKIVKRVVHETYPVKVQVLRKYVYPNPGQNPHLYVEQDLPCFDLTVIRGVSEDEFHRIREGYGFPLTLPKCYEDLNVLGQTVGFLKPDPIAWEASKLIAIPRKPVRIDL